jgi:hypothetical protein
MARDVRLSELRCLPQTPSVNSCRPNFSSRLLQSSQQTPRFFGWPTTLVRLILLASPGILHTRPAEIDQIEWDIVSGLASHGEHKLNFGADSPKKVHDKQLLRTDLCMRVHPSDHRTIPRRRRVVLSTVLASRCSEKLELL